MGRGVGKVLDGLFPGETVLVEYKAYSSPELLLALLQNYSFVRGRNLLVDDVVDTFPEYIMRLKLMGFDVEGLLHASVIKIGGSSEVGNVKGMLDVDKYRLDFKYYDAIYKNLDLGETIINPVLGIYRLFGLFNRRELMRLLRNIAGFVGRGSRVAFYFMNEDAVKELSPEMLPFLEEISSSIFRWGREGINYRLDVLKACDESIIGTSVVMEMGEIREGKL